MRSSQPEYLRAPRFRTAAVSANATSLLVIANEAKRSRGGAGLWIATTRSALGEAGVISSRGTAGARHLNR